MFRGFPKQFNEQIYKIQNKSWTSKTISRTGGFVFTCKSQKQYVEVFHNYYSILTINVIHNSFTLKTVSRNCGLGKGDLTRRYQGPKIMNML